MQLTLNYLFTSVKLLHCVYVNESDFRLCYDNRYLCRCDVFDLKISQMFFKFKLFSITRLCYRKWGRIYRLFLNEIVNWVWVYLSIKSKDRIYDPKLMKRFLKSKSNNKELWINQNLYMNRIVPYLSLYKMIENIACVLNNEISHFSVLHSCLI